MNDGENDINDLIRQSLQRRKGVSSSNYNKFQQNKKLKVLKYDNYLKNVSTESHKSVIKVQSPKQLKNNLHRPNYNDFKFSHIRYEKIRLDLEQGCFNGCIIKNKFVDDEYICAYRENEENICLCRLDKKFQIKPQTIFNLHLHHSADPRLVWIKNNKLLMSYSYYEDDMGSEYISGLIVMDSDNNFILGHPFRISPKSLNCRQKNWAPFVYNGEVYFVSNIKPHTIYKMNGFSDEHTELAYSVDWESKWFNSIEMRGNTPPVLLDEDIFLSTFHTVETKNDVHFYDNGFYIFKACPPFNVIKCASRTFLPAEAACEPYFRKHNSIVCPFPIGMVKENDEIYISYGDNDSSVKILSTTINEVMFNLEHQ